MDKKEINKQVLGALHQASEFGQLKSYSGRGMYGKKCASITDECQDAAMEIIADAIKNFIQYEIIPEIENGENPDNIDYGEFLQRILTFSTDNMGLDVVVYWPSIEWDEAYE